MSKGFQPQISESAKKIIQDAGQDLSEIAVVAHREEIRSYSGKFGPPNAVDEGHGVFGYASGRLFVDDATGKLVAYAPSQKTLREAALQEVLEGGEYFPEVERKLAVLQEAKAALKPAWESLRKHIPQEVVDIIDDAMRNLVAGTATEESVHYAMLQASAALPDVGFASRAGVKPEVIKALTCMVEAFEIAEREGKPDETGDAPDNGPGGPR